MKNGSPAVQMAKEAWAAMARLAKARVEANATGHRFTWTYVRSCRRDLMVDYVRLHPNHPSVRSMKKSDGLLHMNGRKVKALVA